MKPSFGKAPRLMSLALLSCLLLPTFAQAGEEDLEAAPEAHYHAEQQRSIYLESRGITLEYELQGRRSGHPVIFLHGYADSWFSFSRVMPLLPNDLRAYFLTQRGHGDSDKPACCYTMGDYVADVLAFMDELEISKATLVGHSMGSLIAHQFAIEHPDRVEALVLLGSAPKGGNTVLNDFNDFIQSVTEIDLAFVNELQSSTLCVPVPQGFYDTLIAESVKAPLFVWQDALEGLVTEDHSTRLGEIAVPTVIIGGMKDPLFSNEEQIDLARAIPNADFVLYGNLCHSPNWEDPERFATDLVQFLRTRVYTD